MHLLLCKEQSLRYSSRLGATHSAALWQCMWGRGQRGNNGACLVLSWLLVTSSAFYQQIGPFWYRFLGGWVCVCSRTLWVSPTNSPVRLGVSPTAATPTGFYSRRFWGFLFPCWNPGLHGLSHSQVVPPSLSPRKCGTTSYCLARPVTSCCFAVHPLCPASRLRPSYRSG